MVRMDLFRPNNAFVSAFSCFVFIIGSIVALVLVGWVVRLIVQEIAERWREIKMQKIESEE